MLARSSAPLRREGDGSPGSAKIRTANTRFTLLRATPGSPKMRKRDRHRAEALRLAGAPKPSLRDRAVRSEKIRSKNEALLKLKLLG